MSGTLSTRTCCFCPEEVGSSLNTSIVHHCQLQNRGFKWEVLMEYRRIGGHMKGRRVYDRDREGFEDGRMQGG
jgi:hypothetical protein